MLELKKIMGNYMLSVINTAISLLFPIITFTYASRVLGSEKIGVINFVQSYGYYFIHIANLGISSYAIREISKIRNNKEELAKKANEIFNINVFFSGISWIIYCVGVFLIPNLRENAILLIIYSLIIISNFLSLEWLLQSFDDYFFSTFRNTIIRLLSLIAVFIFIKKSNDYIIYMVITTVSEMGARISTFNYSRRKYVKLKISKKFLQFKDHIKPMFTLFLFRLVNGISAQLDKLMIGFFLFYSAVGIYSAGIKIAFMIAPLIENVGIVLFPTLNIASKESKDIYLKGLQINYSIILLMGVPMFVGLFLVSPMTIMLIAGKEYQEAILISRIMSIIILLNPIGDMLGSKILLIHNMNKELLISSTIVAISNVILNVVFIPKWGITGAAIASVASTFISIACRLYYTNKIFKFNILKFCLLKYFCFTIPFIVIYFFSRKSVNKNVFAYVTYVVCCVLIYIVELFIFRDKYFALIIKKFCGGVIMNWNKVFSYIVAVMFRIIPRNNTIWITGQIKEWNYNNTPPVFFDNSKYFFLYLYEKTAERVYWISASKKEIALLESMHLPVLDYHTFKSKWVIARARYSFSHYGDNNINKLSQLGMFQMNFWHGTPLKKIAYDVEPKEKEKFHSIVKFLDRKGKHFLSSTSEFLSENVLQHAFEIDRSQIIDFGYPRTDILRFSKEEIRLFCNKYSRNLLPYMDLIENRKVILYMPTFRDDDYEYFNKANIDFERLNNALVQNNSLFFIKLHPLTNNNINIDKYSNLVSIRNDVDIYPFLKFTDYLVTDYSSIFFDYLILNKEIIFIPYDIERYTAKRELYFDYKNFVPGVQYDTFDAFINEIDNLENLDYSQKRNEIYKLIMNDYQYDACEKTYRFLKREVK